MTEERIIAYLLHDLPEAERERLEDECFDADAWPAEIALAEETLIDDYLRGALTQTQRQRFEQHYLTTPAREQKVALAAALLRHVDEQNAALPATPQVSWPERLRSWFGGPQLAWRLAAAVLAVALLAGLFWRLRRPGAEIAQNYPPPKVFTPLELTARVATRDPAGAPVPAVKQPAPDEALRVTLLLPPGEQAANYRAEMQSAAANQPVRLSAPVVTPGRVVVVIYAPQLAPGQFELKLFALEPERRVPGSYFFDVK
jgi:hypothetical protein